jgi:hypothetical protein
MAPWRSGYAAACKAVYTGSIPVGAFPLSSGIRSLTAEAAGINRASIHSGGAVTAPLVPCDICARYAGCEGQSDPTTVGEAPNERRR